MNTQITTLNGAKAFCKYKEADTSNIDKLLISKTEQRENNINKNSLSQKQQENWINFPILKERFQQFVDYKMDTFDSFTRARNLLLLAFYVYLPPVRIGNYQFMKLRYKKVREAKSLAKGYNYLMIDDDKYTLCFNKYKTAKFLGQINHAITNPNLIKIINHFLVIREKVRTNKRNTQLFFNSVNQKEMTQSNITDTMKQITKQVLGREMSVDLLRHIFITEVAKNQHSIEERKKIANFMGQTYNPTMFEKYIKQPPAPSNGHLMTFD